ncbi:MFS transporter [Rhodococcus sp. ACS1]|uniref:MFS transporter n=1 Tax=Rhodococcus sp. ACS1 TaxID=2028570 RepID=UPI000BB108EC|nr:MFS transporter [Rhodococcus sp. ACS1]PBC39399.1 MFS transporter [Rhodococcus sp. ACS1]PBC39402.1 MFS transporter [Rhodococcus sp. ACS1]
MTDTRDMAHPRAEDAVGNRRQLRRVYFASLIGTTVEFYDFIVFGVAASLVFGRVFFDSTSESLGTILSFAILAIGYAARPLGGIIFGHFGDRVGRKSTLLWTMILMGLSTFLIGCLPSSAQIGVLAPILLVTLRLIQGIAVGGEWGGAVLMAVEHAPKKSRGFFGGAASLGSGAGVLLAYGAFALLNNLDDEAFLTWGWRLPFLFSVVVVAIGLYVRLRVEESPVFESVQHSSEATEKPPIPLIEVFRERPGKVLLGIGTVSGTFMSQAIVSTFLISYAATHYGLSRSTLLTLLNVSLVIMIFTIPFFSFISDKVGRRQIFIPAAVGYAVFAFVMFPMVGSGSPLIILATFIIGMAILNSAATGTSATLLSELFPTKFRYTGAGVAYQFAGLIGGGIGPLLASIFVAPGGIGPIGVSIMLAAFCTLSAICAYRIGDNRTVDLSDA